MESTQVVPVDVVESVVSRGVSGINTGTTSNGGG